jgi:hypothetical protein
MYVNVGGGLRTNKARYFNDHPFQHVVAELAHRNRPIGWS